MSSGRDLNRRDALKRMAGLGLGATVPSLLVNCGDDGNTTSQQPRCLNTCEFAGDGECDDGGPESLYSFCALGTDCADCGPRGGGGYSSGGYSSGAYSSGGYSSGAYSSSSYSSSSYSSSYSSQYCSGYGSLYYYSYRCST